MISETMEQAQDGTEADGIVYRSSDPWRAHLRRREAAERGMRAQRSLEEFS